MSTTQFAASAEKRRSVSSVFQRGSHNGCFGPKPGRVCDKTGPGAFWLSTRLLGLALALLMAAFPARAQENRYQTIELGRIDASDTLRWCWADTWTEDGRRAVQLAQLYTEAYMKREAYLGNEKVQAQEKNGELDQQLAENDAMWEGMRKQYQDFLKQDISAAEKAEIRKYLADIDKQKAESRRMIMEQYRQLHQEFQEMTRDINLADIAPERLHTLKNSIRKRVIGRTIWGFDRVRDFRNGFAAVCYASDQDFGDRWGFVNRQGRLAIPCVWSGVFNFNNQRPYSLSVWDRPEDEDTRPWTSVQKGNLVGMIDTTGTVRVPVKFRFSGRAQLVFVETEKGEVAAARDAQSGKWGLINRKGEWKLKPAYPELEWDQDRNGFVYQDNTGAEKRLAF